MAFNKQLTTSCAHDRFPVTAVKGTIVIPAMNMNPQAERLAKLTELIESGEGHVHIAGACGVGAAGLAVLLAARGFKVSGCDLHTGRMAEWLAARNT